MKVIKDDQLQQDDWVLASEPEDGHSLPEGNLVLPFHFWKEHQGLCSEHEGNIAVYINGDTSLSELVTYLDKFELIGLEFPAFKDGRCYSHARLLRDRYNFKGDIRAVGDVLRDQLFYMKRCGISSFAVREDRDIEDALNALKDFSVTYQGASDDKPPLYKIR